MKLFKKLATFATALTLAFSFGAFTACGETADSYTFTVKNADGTAATDVSVQLCTYAEDGSLANCLMPIPVDENGKCEYTYVTSADVYEIHILDSNDVALEFNESNQTPAKYGEITITLKD